MRLGTCSWSLREWVGKIYTTTEPTEFIREYAQKFSTVEVDSTFYGVPRRDTLLGWRDRTPEDFVFAAKVPQAVTHEKFLEGCEREMDEFLAAMSLLGKRLGPLLLQFPYFARAKNVTLDTFLARLTPFLAKLPRRDFQFVVEVRNKVWLKPALFSVLNAHAVPLALIDHPWMYPPEQLLRCDGILTGPIAYIRWLGDRYGIEKITKTWDQTVIDRGPNIERWAKAIGEIIEKRRPVFGYVNSHYSGYAPADVERIAAAVSKNLEREPWNAE